MEYNSTEDTYKLTQEEATLFNTPDGVQTWPNIDAEMLLSYIQVFERGVIGMDVTSASMSEHMQYVQARRARIAWEARGIVAAHIRAELSPDDIVRLLDGDGL